MHAAPITSISSKPSPQIFSTSRTTPQRKNSNNALIYGAIALVVLIILGLAIYFLGKSGPEDPNPSLSNCPSCKTDTDMGQGNATLLNLGERIGLFITQHQALHTNQLTADCVTQSFKTNIICPDDRGLCGALLPKEVAMDLPKHLLWKYAPSEGVATVIKLGEKQNRITNCTFRKDPATRSYILKRQSDAPISEGHSGSSVHITHKGKKTYHRPNRQSANA